MRGPHNIFRLIRTGATLVRTGAMAVVLDAFDAPRSLRVAAWLLGAPFAWIGIKGDPSLPPATRAITALGPAYIKFGQVLSTRPDVVGDDLARQLRVLRDKLPPFPTERRRKRTALGRGVTQDARGPRRSIEGCFLESTISISPSRGVDRKQYRGAPTPRLSAAQTVEKAR